MIRALKHIIFFGLLFLLPEINVAAQTIRDSSGNVVNVSASNDRKIDSILLHHSPRKAAIRSAILPGWGQAYNKRYWKIPIVYGALGTTAGIFVFNLKSYRDYRFAYKAKFDASLPPGQRDSTNYFKIKPELLPLRLETLRYGRNEYRRNIDYTVLVFILLWGLNVVDATVDAHLRSFDVSPDLSLRFKPGYSDMAKTNGISLVLAIK